MIKIQIRSLEKKIRHESRTVQDETQKFFESQIIELQGSNMTMRGALIKLEEMLDIEIQEQEKNKINFSERRASSVINVLSELLHKFDTVEKRLESMKQHNVVNDYLQTKTMLRQFIKQNT